MKLQLRTLAIRRSKAFVTEFIIEYVTHPVRSCDRIRD
jgi:hypothetical protein